MQPGRASQTAVMVCMGRAIAHIEQQVPGFTDPTALALLPEEARAQVEAYRTQSRPNNARVAMALRFPERRSHMMAVRTVAIDEAVRAAAAPQVVILGAGLDGRAWRMPELANAIVFEVDHPDTQREKIARAGSLTRSAREIRFVPVDFTRDSLDERLAAAGHDPAQPTTWIWEGVVMYLTRADIEATLAVIARRSTPGSHLVIAYVAPAGIILPFVRFIVRRVGEPFKSAFRPDAMRALLAGYGLSVVHDDDVPSIARRLSVTAWRATRRLRHIRIVVAHRTT